MSDKMPLASMAKSLTFASSSFVSAPAMLIERGLRPLLDTLGVAS